MEFDTVRLVPFTERCMKSGHADELHPVGNIKSLVYIPFGAGKMKKGIVIKIDYLRHTGWAYPQVRFKDVI